MNSATEPHTICPCGSGLIYQHCCEAYHYSGHQPAGCTPEKLMRSRYSAFYRGNVDYLIETLHPEYRSKDQYEQLRHALDTHTWRSLRILYASPTKNNLAQVEFVAFCTTNSPEPQQLHENSNFVFDNSRWWYIDGVMLPPIKLKRNDPCWCGSGVKLKKCHS